MRNSTPDKPPRLRTKNKRPTIWGMLNAAASDSFCADEFHVTASREHTKMHPDRGAILAIVLIILLAVTTLGSGLMALSSVSAVEVSKAISSAEAFWAAEGGLELVKTVCAKQRKPLNKMQSFTSDALSFDGSHFVATLGSLTANITFAAPAGWNNATRRVKKYILTASASSRSGITHTLVQQAEVQTFASYMHASQYERTVGGGRIYFADSDVLDGRVYVNDQLNIWGYPQFQRRAFSAAHSVYYQSPSRRPRVDRRVFTKGLHLNARPLDFEDPDKHIDSIQQNANSGGLALNGNYGITFNPNGTVTYRRKTYHGWGSPNTRSLNSLNGAIYVSGSAYVAGKLDGSVTLAARSDIYITNDLIYASATVPDHSDSRFDKNSIDDALGLIAKNSVTIQRSNALKYHDINIHGSILVTRGGFNCARSRERLGNPRINLYGGLTQYRRGVVGYISWPPRGFAKNYRYDQRLRTDPPANFPYSAYVFNTWKQTR